MVYHVGTKQSMFSGCTQPLKERKEDWILGIEGWGEAKGADLAGLCCILREMCPHHWEAVTWSQTWQSHQDLRLEETPPFGALSLAWRESGHGKTS